MASSWHLDGLQEAIDEIQSGKLSYRAAQAKYDIPKSTLHDYVTGKCKMGCRPGPSPGKRKIS